MSINFVKNEQLSFGSSNNKHLLLIGDNKDSLEYLLLTYKGKIKCIYIDPPYGKNGKGKYSKTNYNNAITRDNLLSMLYPRLVLARELLSDDGVLFCSIDDRNQAHVKLLFDEIFGEENFIGSLIWLKGNSQSDAHNMQKNHEYILCYAKNNIKGLLSTKKTKDVELLEENGKYFYLGAQIVTGGAGGRLNDRNKLGYTIYYNPITKDKKAIIDYDLERAKTSNDENYIYKDNTELLEKGYIKIRPPKKGNKLGRWTWSAEKFNNEKESIYIKETGNGYIPVKKEYIVSSMTTIEKDAPINSFKSISSTLGTQCLLSLFNDKFFDNSKPCELISYLLQSYQNPNAIILDFFAGSGTTGEAVLKLNREDGGNRKFILCQNNEKTKTTPNGIAYDVTAKRLKRVMTGECYDGTKPEAWLKKNEPYGGALDVLEYVE